MNWWTMVLGTPKRGRLVQTLSQERCPRRSEPALEVHRNCRCWVDSVHKQHVSVVDGFRHGFTEHLVKGRRARERSL